VVVATGGRNRADGSEIKFDFCELRMGSFILAAHPGGKAVLLVLMIDVWDADGSLGGFSGTKVGFHVRIYWTHRAWDMYRTPRGWISSNSARIYPAELRKKEKVAGAGFREAQGRARLGRRVIDLCRSPPAARPIVPPYFISLCKCSWSLSFVCDLTPSPLDDAVGDGFARPERAGACLSAERRNSGATAGEVSDAIGAGRIHDVLIATKGESQLTAEPDASGRLRARGPGVRFIAGRRSGFDSVSIIHCWFSAGLGRNRDSGFAWL